jgi:hypothetical protein
MDFELVGAIDQIQTFATGKSIRELPRLRKVYGRGRWRKRKRKGVATVRLADGSERLAEVRWYEATGIGRKELKTKRYLDEQFEPTVTRRRVRAASAPFHYAVM